MYEFMAASIPVIASRLMAVEAYFDERAITYFESDKPASLADAILRIHRDPVRRAAQVESATRLYASYSWEKQQGIYLSNFRRFWP
jgi:glycosyltransferase involved in cell wall biosynthesis